MNRDKSYFDEEGMEQSCADINDYCGIFTDECGLNRENMRETLSYFATETDCCGGQGILWIIHLSNRNLSVGVISSKARC